MGEGQDARFQSWNLGLIAAGLTAVFLVLVNLYSAFGQPKLDKVCDRLNGAAGQGACECVRDPDSPTVCNGDWDAPTEMSGEFVRVIPPFVERIAWWTASGALLTLVLAMLIPSSRWWHRLRRDLGPRRGALSDMLVPVALASLVSVLVLLPVVGSESRLFSTLIAIPTAVSWLAAVPAIAALLDVHATASLGHPALERSETTGVAAVRRLRQYLDRLVAILGLQIAAWVVWYGALVRLLDAKDTAGLARQGGTFNVTPRGSISVIVNGTLATALLAFVFLACGVKKIDRPL